MAVYTSGVWLFLCSEVWLSICSEVWLFYAVRCGCLYAMRYSCLYAVRYGCLYAVRCGCLYAVRYFKMGKTQNQELLHLNGSQCAQGLAATQTFLSTHSFHNVTKPRLR